VRSRRSAAALLAVCAVAVLAVGCRSQPGTSGDAAGSGSAATPPASAAVGDDPLARAQAAAKLLGGTLRGKLEQAMAQGGPARAIEVCASEAQAVAAKVRADTGVAVGRSSRRLRNPADAAPPWVAEWLAAQGDRKAAGVTGVRTLADGPQGRVARVLLPIELEPKCLACHGDPATLAPEVKAVLAARYPGDAATGYAAGDLRGALWAEAPAR
jgi:hypothetical protein